MESTPIFFSQTPKWALHQFHVQVVAHFRLLLPSGTPACNHLCRLLGLFFRRFLLFNLRHHPGVEGLGSLRHLLREDPVNTTSPSFHALSAFRHLFDGPPFSLFSLFDEDAVLFAEMARTPSAPPTFFCPFPAFLDSGNRSGAPAGRCTGR